MARSSVKKITVNQNVRCERIIPVENSINTPCPANHSKLWKGNTVAFQLTKEQAVQLARVLLAATQEWDHISITAFRYQRRKDGTYPVTVTSVVEPETA
jgi:hypothetical protein